MAILAIHRQGPQQKSASTIAFMGTRAVKISDILLLHCDRPIELSWAG